jgi:hypothetical protein
MKYKYLIIIIILNFTLVSCSNEENNCLTEKNEIIERFNKLIELAEGDELQKRALIQQRDANIKKLGC